jgi:hypothetical protein
MKLELLHTFPNMPGIKYPMRVFMGLLPTERGYGGCVREHNAERRETETDLRRVAFDEKFNLVEDEFFCRSDDCRVFGWGDKICGLGCLTKPDGNGLDYLAMNFSHAKWSHLSFPGAKFVGKNLVPIQPGADGLHILQRVSPPVVWKVKMEDGTCSRLFGGEIDSESIGQLRGGAAALSTGETITGWGHRTRSADCHTPFYYEVSRSSVFIEDIDGMEGINDPTSAWDDKLLICHTEKAWTVNQPCEHRLYRVIQ